MMIYQHYTVVDSVPAWMLLACADNRMPVGSVELRPGRKSLGMRRLFVSETYRRRGVGRALMGVAERIAQAARLESIGLQVDEENEGAIAFYRTLEFVVGYEHDDGSLAMFKTIGGPR